MGPKGLEARFTSVIAVAGVAALAAVLPMMLDHLKSAATIDLLLILLTSAVSSVVSRTPLNPMTLFCTSWLVALFFYDQGLASFETAVSTHTRTLILVMLGSFCTGYLLGSAASRSRYQYRPYSMGSASQIWKLTRWYGLLGIAAHSILFSQISIQAITYSGIVSAFRTTSFDYGGILGRLVVLSRVSLILGAACFLYYGKPKTPTSLIIVAANAFVLALIPQRAGLVTALLTVGLFSTMIRRPHSFRHPSSWKPIARGIMILAGAIGFFAITQHLLGKGTGFQPVVDYVALNIPNLDAVLSHSSKSYGRRSFYFVLLAIERVARYFGFRTTLTSAEYNPLTGYANPDLGYFNTVPFIREFYLDFGLVGLGVIAFILGSVSSVIHFRSMVTEGFIPVLLEAVLSAWLVLSIRQNEFCGYDSWWTAALLFIPLCVVTRKHAQQCKKTYSHPMR